MHLFSISSPAGRLTLAADDNALVAINWGGAGDDASTPLLAETARQLDAYFAGRLTRFDVPLAPAGSSFEHAVWTAMQAIPHGETRYYGDLARTIDCPSPRAIGRACGRNPIPIIIPCHRVLARGGLGGYSGEGGLKTKRILLALEGAMPAEMPLFAPSPADRGSRQSAVTKPGNVAMVAPR